MIKKQLQRISQLSKSYQSSLYVVGGTLRDIILGQECADFDFTVRGASTLAKEYKIKNNRAKEELSRD